MIKWRNENEEKFLYSLQAFAEAVQGKRIVYLFRIASEASTTAGKRIPFVTEDSQNKKCKDADSTATKDGSIRTPGTAEVEISTTLILSKGDEIVKKIGRCNG